MDENNSSDSATASTTTAFVGTAHANVTVTGCGLRDPALTAARTCDGSMQNIVVHVKVTLRVDTTLLDLVHFSHFTESATAAARPFEGPTTTEAGRC